MHPQPSKRLVALVFDDGPVPGMTQKYLSLLESLGVHVTFAYVGKNVASHPLLAKAAAQSGHELVNHSYDHPHFPALEESEIKRQILETQQGILKASGKAVRWFWPPYLEYDDRIDQVVRSAGIERFPIARFHLISTEDWNPETDGNTIRERATRDIPLPSVILCHEWRLETLEQISAIITELRAQGCAFVTFSELSSLILHQCAATTIHAQGRPGDEACGG